MRGGRSVRDRRAWVAVVVLGVVTVALGATAAVNRPEEPHKPLEKRLHENPQDLMKFWTPERIKEANRHGL